MPQHAHVFDTEPVLWRKLAQNLYEEYGTPFPFQGGLNWESYVRGVLNLWGQESQGPEGWLVKQFASQLSAQYGLGASIGVFDTPTSALRTVAIAASGVSLIPGADERDSLVALIEWSATL